MQKTSNSTSHTPFVGGLPSEMARVGIVSALLNRASNLLRRRKLTRLEQLDDRMLDDIGITRLDLTWARSLPLGRNPLLALDGVARGRARTRRHSAVQDLPGTRKRFQTVTTCESGCT